MSYHEKGYHRVNRIVGEWKDDRTVAKGVTTEVVASGMVYLTVTVPNLNFIEEILDLQVSHTDPATTAYGLCNKTIEGNVVGITVTNVGAGTTLTLEAIAVGV